MSEKVFFNKKGSIVVFNPNVFDIRIIRESDEQFTIIMDGHEKHYTKYVKLDRILEELLDLKYDISDVDKDKSRLVWG